MDTVILDRLCGCAVGAAVGDALGMPLEFGPRRAPAGWVRDMLPGRIPAGSFTDDTEMALALAESLLAQRPLDPADLAQRFVAWYQAGPPDVGIHTAGVLQRIASGATWEAASAAAQAAQPNAAGNGSIMRCWPAALAYWDDFARLIHDSRLQSLVTHPHAECVAGSVLINVLIFHLLRGMAPAEAVARALDTAEAPAGLRAVVEAAPTRTHETLSNSGWVRHTIESAVWSLLTADSFEAAVVQVVNLGQDADTAGAVVGALAGARYGLAGIPERWQAALRGVWPMGSGKVWDAQALAQLAARLAHVAI